MSEQLYAARTFEEFWDHYQELHAGRGTRLAHAVATSSAILLLVLAVARRSRKLALAAPVVDYAIAQLAHRSTGERTQPYRKPLWHVRAELRLFRSTLRSIAQGRGGRRDPYVGD
ncbi:MAG TPA: Mpo1-like protein [Kofleriaceae bacterium]